LDFGNQLIAQCGGWFRSENGSGLPRLAHRATGRFAAGRNAQLGIAARKSWLSDQLGSVEIILTGNADQSKQRIAPGVGQCRVETGETPQLFGAEPPRPRLEAVRIVDMSASDSWAEFAAVFRRTRPAFVEHEGAKADLKKLVPEDAKEATGHGLRAKRSKSGAISFDLLDVEAADAPLQ